MFQPAASIRSQVQNEGVVVIGHLSEHGNFGGDDFLNFVAQTNGIVVAFAIDHDAMPYRSEEHTSELQSQSNLVCRLLLEKKTQSSDVDASDRCLVRVVY